MMQRMKVFQKETTLAKPPPPTLPRRLSAVSHYGSAEGKGEGGVTMKSFAQWGMSSVQ